MHRAPRLGRTVARSLLATSSVAALLIGGGARPAYAVLPCEFGGIALNGVSQGGVNNPGAISCIYINNSTINGSVTNPVGDTITTVNGPPSSTGITISNSTITGNVSNAGVISASAIGILVNNGASIGGVISNSGTITAAGAYGIIVSGATLSTAASPGGITNSGTIMGASQAGIAVRSAASFVGSISNAGTISSGNGGISVDGVTNFLGNISNSGTINSNFTGIAVTNVSTFSGGITNSGTITPAFGNGIAVGGRVSGTGANLVVFGFGANISNSGTISAFVNGVIVGGTAQSGASVSVSNFGGGIINSGKITAISGNGIIVGGKASGAAFLGTPSTVTVTTFAGNITNSGTISAPFASGIVVGGQASGFGVSVTVSTFGGNIVNLGKITASSPAGILVGGRAEGTFASVTIGTFGGGITNLGTISVHRGDGIMVGGSATGFGASVTISAFSGGISNSGTISVGSGGIVVGGNATTNASVAITTFGGGITNSGTISAGFAGIAVNNVVNFTSGNISNSGNIIAHSSNGIIVSAVTNFVGNIINSGTITASRGSGIRVDHTSTFTGDITNSGTIAAHRTGIAVGCECGISTFAGNIINSGTITAGAANIGIFAENITSFLGSVSNSGTIGAGIGILVGVATRGAFTATNAVFGGGSSPGGITNTGMISARFAGIFVGGTSGATYTLSSFGGGISNAGTISAGHYGIYVGPISTSTVTISTFSGGITNSGLISATLGVGIFVGASSHSTLTLGTFSGNISNSGTITGKTGIMIGSGVTFAGGAAIVNTGVITGTSGTAINLTNSTSPVSVTIAGGAINGNMLGAGLASGDILNFSLTPGQTFTYNSNFTNFSTVNINSGTVVLNGVDSATFMTVFDGGILAGTGTLDPTLQIFSGGTLAPGTPGGLGTLAINGSLQFFATSYYAININPGSNNNSGAAVTGTAALSGGTVVVTPQLGTYTAGTHYQILTTTGGLGGTSFAGLTINGRFTGTMSLDYATDPGDVDLDVNATGYSLLSPPSGLNQNQQNVLNGINNAILQGDTVPPGFINLGGLSGPALSNALTQLSGLDGTGAQTSAFQLMTDFLNLFSDPTAGGGGAGGTNGPQQFAPDDQASLPLEIAQAYNHVLRNGSPQPAPSLEQRWSAWASGYGGYNTTQGNATVGSANVTATDYGSAAGMTYHATPATSYGFALAGAGTNWNVAQNLGSGRSDSFQAGVYATTHFGLAYLSGALAFANHWFTTNRIALGDDLTAKFQGQSYAARGEAGYRYAVPVTGYIIGITPYAALQVQDFHTPAYSETDLTGGGLGLTYSSMNATDTRSELGARFDNLTVWDGMPLVLRGRLAWAHDWVSNPALGAVFETLPGSNFTVNGVTPPKNSALTTAGAELHLSPNWTAMAKFDGAFASGSQTYAGTGTLRYSW